MVEPPDIFEGRFPAKFADHAPRIVEMDNGGQAWLWNDQLLPNVGFNAVAGRPRVSTPSSRPASITCAGGPGTPSSAWSTWT